MPALLNVILDNDKTLDIFYPGNNSKKIAEIVDKVSEYFDKQKGAPKVKEYVYHEIPEDAELVCRNCGSVHIADISKLQAEKKIRVMAGVAPDAHCYERIKYYRELAGLTRTDVAKRLRISEATMAKWEKGGRMPTLSNLIDIAKVLGVKPADLVPNVVLENDLPEPEEEDKEKSSPDILDEASWVTVFDELNDDESETIEDIKEKVPF